MPNGPGATRWSISGWDTEPDKVYASYIVVLPVRADFGKYVPPFLASHLGNVPPERFFLLRYAAGAGRG